MAVYKCEVCDNLYDEENINWEYPVTALGVIYYHGTTH